MNPRLCPIVFTKALIKLSRHSNHLFDEILTMNILEIQQIFTFQFRFICIEHHNTIQTNGKKIAAPMFKTYGPQSIKYHPLNLCISFSGFILLVNVFGYSVGYANLLFNGAFSPLFAE